MHRYLLFLLAFLLFSAILPAQDNHMDIMTTIMGDSTGYNFGFVSTTLDWNGDGYDDLFLSDMWYPPELYGVPNAIGYGKINIYYGCPEFDNIPDFCFIGQYPLEYSDLSMCNAGDMNGDGIDDLALFKGSMYEGTDISQRDLQLCIYYGGAEPDTIPDFVLTFPYEDWDNSYGTLSSLGDVNHDGYDDLGYSIRPNLFRSMILSFNILYGHSMSDTNFMRAGKGSACSNMRGLSDVNGDGVDDFCVGYDYRIGESSYTRSILYFGDTSGVYSDSLVICDLSGIGSTFSFPVGDINRDGIADFVSYFTGTSARLYFGSANLSLNNYVLLPDCFYGTFGGDGFGYGDFNHSGGDDIISTRTQLMGGDGYANLWLGGGTMNGGVDLVINPTWQSSEMMFGHSLTTGDYNNDGYCDVAISAPFNYNGTPPTPGIVYVYAGNAQLNDPTPNADGTETPVISKLRLFPNPLLDSNQLSIHFDKQSITNNQTTFTIFNIKGQKITSFLLTPEQAKSGTVSFELPNLMSGIYLCRLQSGQNCLTGKLSIIR